MNRPESARWLLVRVGRCMLCAASLGLSFPSTAAAQSSTAVRVGCKNFTEQEILGELVAQLIERHTDLTVERRFGLGGTDICHAALKAGELDLYVEYTGTALLNVLGEPVIDDSDGAFRAVASMYRERFDLEWLPPVGFNNTYAIAVRGDEAEASGWTRVSDLSAAAKELRAGFTSEFMERPDGYPGLRRAYDMEFGRAVDLDPGLMYRALADGEVDLICAFATDGRIDEYGLRILEDDRRFFPPYDAAPVVRRALLRENPELRDALVGLARTVSDEQMRQLNFAVDVLRREPRKVAEEWLDRRAGQLSAGTGEHHVAAIEDRGLLSLFADRRIEVLQKTGEHLLLTLLGVLIAMGLGIPTGIMIHRIAPVRGPVLAVTEVVQTIPSLAMLAFLFAIHGLLGATPAVTALVLYALLPIVLNTFTGLREVPSEVLEAADGVGMSSRQRLRLVELPLAAPVMIAGIRTATVLTIGIATLCTYIGAGGLGDFIARGLSRNDPRLTLLGAVPAAIMAVVLSLIIRWIERAVKRG
ncbi:MAG: glycine betaine ABC transporter substrate-binding protein [Gemmatimonadota bacterium]